VILTRVRPMQYLQTLFPFLSFFSLSLLFTIYFFPLLSFSRLDAFVFFTSYFFCFLSFASFLSLGWTTLVILTTKPARCNHRSTLTGKTIYIRGVFSPLVFKKIWV
jgi:hypothetical protein